MTVDLKSRRFMLMQARDELVKTPHLYETQNLAQVATLLDLILAGWPVEEPDMNAAPRSFASPLGYTRVGEVQVSSPTIIVTVEQAASFGWITLNAAADSAAGRSASDPEGERSPPSPGTGSA